MKRFTKYMILFVIPLLLIFGGVEYFLRQQESVFTYKAQYMENNAANIECLVLGNSRTYIGINPALFSVKSFNLAYFSQILKNDYLILSKYESKMTSLQYLILNVDLRFQGANRTKHDKWACFYNEYGILNDRFDENLFVLAFPAKDLIKRRGTFPFKCDSLGMGLDYHITNRSETWKERVSYGAKRDTKPYDKDLLERNISYLEKIIYIATKHNTKVILLNPPTHELYRNLLDKDQVERNDSVSKNLAAKYTNVYFYDFSADPDFVDDDYYDGDHLNNIGADKFTKKVDSCLFKIAK